MIEIPLVILGVGLLGMVAIITRHISEILRLSHVDNNGVATQHPHHDVEHLRVRAMSLFEDIERLFKTRAVPFFFWMAEIFFAIIERGSKYVASASKHFRLTMHERSAKPRESLYWNEMTHWKEEEDVKKKGEK